MTCGLRTHQRVKPPKWPGVPKPPVMDIKLWLECYSRMAAILVTHFPEKGPELWAYQTTILKAAHNYEGSNWVAYDRQFRRDMLARKDLNWLTPNARLYNEAFTGRAKLIPRCQHCLCEDHTSAACSYNPNPQYVAWVTPPGSMAPPSVFPPALLVPAAQWAAPTPGSLPRSDICRSFNENRCRFATHMHAASASVPIPRWRALGGPPPKPNGTGQPTVPGHTSHVRTPRLNSNPRRGRPRQDR